MRRPFIREFCPDETHWAILAALRFLLASIILSCHLTWFIQPDSVFLALGKLGGLSAVIGFLLISGYSIANSINLQRVGFYKRRFLRIYPMYIAAIILSLVPFLFYGPTVDALNRSFELPDGWTILGNVFLLQGFATLYIDSNPIVWTLSLEVLCYILAPIFSGMSNRMILLYIIMSSIVFGAYQQFSLPYFSEIRYGIGFVVLLWAWLTGFLYYKHRTNQAIRIFIIIIGCIILEINNAYNNKLSIFTYIMSSTCLIASPYIRIHQKLGSVLKYMGDLSYPLYLCNLPALMIGYSLGNVRNPALLILCVLISTVLFYHAIDVPVRKRKILSDHRVEKNSSYCISRMTF